MTSSPPRYHKETCALFQEVDLTNSSKGLLGCTCGPPRSADVYAMTWMQQWEHLIKTEELADFAIAMQILAQDFRAYATEQVAQARAEVKGKLCENCRTILEQG